MRHLILLLALYGGYQAWEHFSRAPKESNAPLHAEPYLAVRLRLHPSHPAPA